jgi:glycerophosphoryl diester phosphodiesterase
MSRMIAIPRPMKIAHRGIPQRERENTLASFALALAEGAEGIELDVHVTKDGEVVVHHDPATADGHVITQSNLAELREDASPRNIPTLGEVLSLVAGSVELFVELKGNRTEKATMDALAGYGGPAALHSFDHAMIGRAASMKCPWRLGLLTEEVVEDPVELLRTYGASDFWPQEALVSAAIVHAVHGFGGRVIAWTVNAPQRMQQLSALGVDGLCTDDVSAVNAALGGSP